MIIPPTLEFECGDTSLSVRRVSARERISELFVVDVLAVSADEHLELGKFVGLGAGLAAESDAGLIAWTGICSYMEQVKPSQEQTGRSTYLLRIVPAMWLLTQRRGHRIFQHQKAPDIVKKVLAEYRIEPDLKLTGDYKRHEYCVQYGETDFAFVSRLLEEVGISYFFDRQKAGDKAKSILTLADAPTTGPSLGNIDYYDAPNEGQIRELFITDVQVGHGVRPGKVTVRDYDFRKPALALWDSSKFPLADKEKLEEEYEQYHWVPGASLWETDGADDKLPVADDKSIARHDKKLNEAWANRHAEAARYTKKSVAFRTNKAALGAAKIFGIEHHPRSQLEGKRLMVVEINVSLTELDWTLIGEAVFADVPFRSPVKTPKPRVEGIQTAMVVGPPGEEIYTDEYSRVRVRFHWDREGKYDDNSTCWLRVSQAWAGSAFGVLHIPRIGQEVIVDFFDGDPDQPIVVGRVFNATTRVPRKLPDHKTQSIWRSASSPQTDGKFNEIMLDDQKGKELYFFQAERDLQRLVKRNDTERTGKDRTIVVGEGRVAAVAASDSLQVGKQHLVKMATVGDLKIADMGEPQVTPLKTFVEMVDKKITLTTGEATIELSGPNITVDAKGGLRFTTDGRLIMKGSMVYLNVMPGQAQPQADKSVKDAVAKPNRMIGAVEKLFWQPKADELARKEQAVKLTERKVAAPVKVPDKPSCAELWAKYEKEAKDILAPAGNDVYKRNQIINGAYADLALKNPEMTWAGEAAYASKQVGCGIAHAQALQKKWYMPAAPAKFGEQMLAKTNKDIFMDAYPTHRFYADNGAKRLRECSKEKSDLRPTENTLKSFDALDKYKETKDPKYLKEHSRAMLDHEQRELAQHTAYADKKMRALLVASQAGSKVPGAKSLAPPAELVFEPGCDGQRKTQFKGWDLGNEKQRMDWVGGDMEKQYYNLITNDKAVHLKQLEQMRSTGVSNGGTYP